MCKHFSCGVLSVSKMVISITMMAMMIIKDETCPLVMLFQVPACDGPSPCGGCVIWGICSDMLHNRWTSRLLSWQQPSKLFFITYAFTFITLFLWAYSVGMMERWKTLDPRFQSMLFFGCWQFSKHCVCRN